MKSWIHKARETRISLAGVVIVALLVALAYTGSVAWEHRFDHRNLHILFQWVQQADKEIAALKKAQPKAPAVVAQAPEAK